jgi:ribonuclease BN (tRNA processing enzyme)
MRIGSARLARHLCEMARRGALLAVAAGVLSPGATQAQRAAGPESPRSGTAIVLLGTGTPAPNPNAFGPATAIVVGDRLFVVDAGVGVARRLTAADLPVAGISALFVTHLHSDHTLGYPDLILTSWISGRTRPFDVYGPPGIRSMTDHILAAWSEDIRMRTTGGEHRPATAGVSVHEIHPGVVYDRDAVRVTAFPVQHGSWRYAFGYRFDTPDRSIVLSGDTRPSDSLVAAARQCDVLIHEAHVSTGAPPPHPPGGADWPQYMHDFHTSDVELGALAARIQPGLLIVNHTGLFNRTADELIAGIRRGGFSGRVAIGKDLERY